MVSKEVIDLSQRLKIMTLVVLEQAGKMSTETAAKHLGMSVEGWDRQKQFVFEAAESWTPSFCCDVCDAPFGEGDGGVGYRIPESAEAPLELGAPAAHMQHLCKRCVASIGIALIKSYPRGEGQ